MSTASRKARDEAGQRDESTREQQVGVRSLKRSRGR